MRLKIIYVTLNNPTTTFLERPRGTWSYVNVMNDFVILGDALKVNSFTVEYFFELFVGGVSRSYAPYVHPLAMPSW